MNMTSASEGSINFTTNRYSEVTQSKIAAYRKARSTDYIPIGVCKSSYIAKVSAIHSEIFPAILEHENLATAEEGDLNEVEKIIYEVLGTKESKEEILVPVQITDRIFFLDLANRKLKTIPWQVFELEDLEELHLERNEICSISGAISNLKNIRVLYLNKNRISKLCEELGELKRLRSLDLSSNPLPFNSLTVISKIRSLSHLRFYDLNLDEFPLEICRHLHHLKLLGLSNNNLKCLPKEIVNFTKLQELYLKENGFEHFPLELCQLHNLEIIDLEKNNLSVIPNEISSLQNLSQLYLACNKLTMVPDSLSKCCKLSLLDLSTNQLYKLPRSFKQLTEMKEFSISGNTLASFPRPLRHWKCLTVIYMKNCGLKALHPSFGKLTNTIILDLSQNLLEEFPAQICAMENLEILSLDDNQIRKIPPAVNKLYQLKSLGLTGNRFNSFPEEIFHIASLETLYLGQDRGIKLTVLPENISQLQKAYPDEVIVCFGCKCCAERRLASIRGFCTGSPPFMRRHLRRHHQNLKELYIENNFLEYLPSSIRLLNNLEILDAHNNLLIELPDSICQLQGLQKLLLHNNQLFQIPEDLDSLEKLQVLSLEGNPMMNPSVEVFSQGLPAIWEYLRQERKTKETAVKVQAWWRGLRVRKGVGVYSEILKMMKKAKKEKKEKKGKEKEKPKDRKK